MLIEKPVIASPLSGDCGIEPKTSAGGRLLRRRQQPWLGIQHSLHASPICGMEIA
ncbi:MAG: hypothetical protein AB9866_30035 [Syntrophobacteraceae bacterium]